ADCIATATYQATFQGFRARGLGDDEADAAFGLAVRLAVEARDDFWSRPGNRPGRLRPLVAASVGPYGAFLADGSEYRGDYDLDLEGLVAFHRRRWTRLAASPADLLGCETLPSGVEARALLRLLDETPDRWAWLSFQCRDEGHLADGTPLGEVADLCVAHPRVAGVGVNCVPPGSVTGLLGTLGERRAGRPPASGGVPLIAYPNSGEVYDAVTKRWRPGDKAVGLGALAAAWHRQGATVLGGCCRTAPETIGAMRRALLTPS
ncbi:MAG TPA: homocysteine S-methyltransferase, partial [Longimicrobiales bacterium]|nr:homocysteine S-methyltransferase [Longimicrobiales bacterium]